MSDKELGSPERAALLALMAAGSPIANPDLERLAGFRLKGEPLRKLTERGLVESNRDPGRKGKPLVLSLTAQGWAWCDRELTADLPPRPGSGGGALYAVLRGLHRYLEREGLRLADLFAAGPAASAPAPAPAPAPAAPPVTGDLEERIRLAYGKLASRPGDWVSLTNLRPLLGGAERQEVDAALRRLSRTRQATLVPQANQKVLTRADREAAIRIGLEDCHLILIEE